MNKKRHVIRHWMALPMTVPGGRTGTGAPRFGYGGHPGTYGYMVSKDEFFSYKGKD